MCEKKPRENYTRVTNILYPFSGLDKIDPCVLAYAADRGTRVHKICEGIIQGLGEIGVDEETQGYVDSFKQWWAIGHDVIMMEQRFWDDELEITGQVDLIIRRPSGLLGIVDLKTSSKPSKTWPIQGNAYAYLAKKSKHWINEIQFIHLNKNGGAPRIYDYPVDPALFLSVHSVWSHFFKKE
jgi:hypothetical protein